MEARYRRSNDRQYLLSDLEDESQYESVQGFKDNVICVCQESTYRFAEKVIDGIASIYRAADAPLKTIHIGGDEVPAGVWQRSPACQSFLAEHPEVDDLFAYFVERLRAMLDSKGLATAGWEEIGVKDHVPNPELAGRVVPYIWNNLGENQDLVYRLANAGYEVVICNVTNLYFDLAYDKDPEESGLYWGGFVDTRRAFELVPLDVFKSNRQDALGNRYDFVTLRMVMEQLKPENRKNILGIQGQLWSETLKGQDMMEYYLFPKLIGLAERGWAPVPLWAEIEDTREREAALSDAWNSMANVIGQRELPRLDYLAGGVGYRIPPPGAVIDNGRLEANVAYPGLAIRYTTDGSEPNATSPLYTEAVAVSDRVRVRAFDSRGRGSRTVEVGPN
jgi:hexosaminidase